MLGDIWTISSKVKKRQEAYVILQKDAEDNIDETCYEQRGLGKN